MEFVGLDNSFAGTLSGGGAFVLGGGSDNTIGSGTKITAATFEIHAGATVALGGNLSYTGIFDFWGRLAERRHRHRNQSTDDR